MCRSNAKGMSSESMVTNQPAECCRAGGNLFSTADPQKAELLFLVDICTYYPPRDAS